MGSSFFSYAAKAVVAFVAPYVVAAVVWGVGEVGADVPGWFDIHWVEATLVAVITSVAVYLKRNRPSPV